MLTRSQLRALVLAGVDLVEDLLRERRAARRLDTDMWTADPLLGHRRTDPPDPLIRGHSVRRPSGALTADDRVCEARRYQSCA